MRRRWCAVVGEHEPHEFFHDGRLDGFHAGGQASGTYECTGREPSAVEDVRKAAETIASNPADPEHNALERALVAYLAANRWLIEDKINTFRYERHAEPNAAMVPDYFADVAWSRSIISGETTLALVTPTFTDHTDDTLPSLHRIAPTDHRRTLLNHEPKESE